MLKVVLFQFFLLIVGFAFAQKVSPAEIKQVADNFEKENHILKSAYAVLPLVSQNDTLAFVYNYQDAFVVISNYKNLPPVKAYSTENNFSNEVLNQESGIRFSDILIDDLENSLKNNGPQNKFSIENRKAWKQIYNPVSKGTATQYGPWLDNLYGQTKCKDENNKYINVTNIYTPHNYAVGCVAITFVEVLQYYEWPRIGIGSHSYNDNSGTTKGLHSVRFDKKYYNWGLIKDEYYKVPSTIAERQELGNLAYHCAVSVDMDFEYNGATSNINRIPKAANDYFRYTASHIYKTVPDFWAQVDSNVINGFPVQFAVYTSTGAGHAVVCDGIKPDVPSKQYYHLNMGWWGADNGWYLIQNGFNAGGYTNIKAAVVDMFPVPELEEPKLNAEDETLEITWYYPVRKAAEAFELQVKVGVQNWKTIADDIQGLSYEYDYTSTEVHRFRVRAKMAGKWNALGYSNNMSIDVQKELDKSKVKELRVYPTLVIDDVTVEYSNLANCSIEIYNALGIRVYEQKQGGSPLSKRVINLQTLTSGIYLVRVYGGGIDQSIKIFKN